MPFSKSYRRYRRGARRTRIMGGIRKGFRGSRFRRRPMTTGRDKNTSYTEPRNKIRIS